MQYDKQGRGPGPFFMSTSMDVHFPKGSQVKSVPCDCSILKRMCNSCTRNTTGLTNVPLKLLSGIAGALSAVTAVLHDESLIGVVSSSARSPMPCFKHEQNQWEYGGLLPFMATLREDAIDRRKSLLGRGQDF